MYDAAKGEKRLLALINATVSHEMRNPANSIRCQNLLQKQLNEQVAELLDNEDLSLSALKQQFRNILMQYIETVDIQMSSEKILTFLINDILDFASMRASKFRKVASQF